MKWEVIKPQMQPIGRDRDDSLVHWHKAVMRVVGVVEAPTAAAAIAAAKQAGHTAPLVQPADGAAAARFLAKIRSLARTPREAAEVA